jgi:hypothetical protein
MHGASVTTSEASKPMISDRLFGLVALLAVLPVFFAFAIAGQPARGRAAAISAGMIIVVARFTWEQRKCIWYWVTMSCFATVHTVVVLLVTWQEKSYPGFTLLPVAAADFAAMYGVIRLIETLVKARSGHSGKRSKFDEDSRY